jgi:hypothetical protein
MKNTSGRVSHMTRESILTDYMRKLKRFGYPEFFGARFLSKAWKVIPRWSSLRLQALVLLTDQEESDHRGKRGEN